MKKHCPNLIRRKRLINFYRIKWDSNPRYLINTLVFKTNTLNHSAIYPEVVLLNKNSKKKGLEPLTAVLETIILPIKLFFHRLKRT